MLRERLRFLCDDRKSVQRPNTEWGMTTEKQTDVEVQVSGQPGGVGLRWLGDFSDLHSDRGAVWNLVFGREHPAHKYFVGWRVIRPSIT